MADRQWNGPADFGKWHVESLLGSGGQGTVLLVSDRTGTVEDTTVTNKFAEVVRMMVRSDHQERINNAAKRILTLTKLIGEPRPKAALKVLHARDHKSRARFQNEINNIRKIAHPSLITLVEAGESEGWFVMTYFPEGTLSTRLTTTAGKAYESLLALRPIIDAVALLHKEGLVHRDIKPDNIFITGEKLILGDFGLVIDVTADDRATSTYENVGSRDWMPGWAQGMRLDDVKPTFDVFSLGKVLWSMVTGKAKLPLWYHDKPQFDPEKLFPDEPAMHWIKRLLMKTVVENEEQCLPTAADLLRQVDRTLQAIRSGAQRIDANVRRVCVVCGLGEYERRWDEAAPYRVGSAATDLVAASKMFACSYCGHVQLFLISDRPEPPEAWRTGK